VPIYKKNGKLRVCIDFRDLNKATPMDGYPMSIANMLVDAAARHKVISFIDGNADYNQIFMCHTWFSKEQNQANHMCAQEVHTYVRMKKYQKQCYYITYT
jgi:hypothetical protein